MGIVQINIFGEETPMEAVLGNIPKPKGRKRRRTMQEMHGINDAHTCRECEHLVKRQYSRVYYKCELWSMASSHQSDIRVTQKSCNKFKLSKGAMA
ncbi:MAG: hypothetical protein FWB87_13760 [Defluviitaleaceae bacterium]|nr:hypothetical protein [Defluviitaleaceae bacterium]